jgi:hypothetical protein
MNEILSTIGSLIIIVGCLLRLYFKKHRLKKLILKHFGSSIVTHMQGNTIEDDLLFTWGDSFVGVPKNYTKLDRLILWLYYTIYVD